MDKKITFTTVIIAAIGLGLAASTPAKAASSLLDKCQASSSRQNVEKCCNTWIRQNGRPMWLSRDFSCGNVVSCSPGRLSRSVTAVAYVPKCRIDMPQPLGGKSSSRPLRGVKG